MSTVAEVLKLDAEVDMQRVSKNGKGRPEGRVDPTKYPGNDTKEFVKAAERFRVSISSPSLEIGGAEMVGHA